MQQHQQQQQQLRNGYHNLIVARLVARFVCFAFTLSIIMSLLPATRLDAANLPQANLQAQSQQLQLNQQLNQQTNQQTNQQLNQQTNQQLNQQTNQQTNQQLNQQTNQQTPTTQPNESLLLRTEQDYSVEQNIDGFTYTQVKPNSIYALVRRVSKYGITDYFRAQADQKIHAAGLTQLMTYYVCEAYFSEARKDRHETITIQQEDLANAERGGAALAGFLPGDKVPITELYYAMILTSGAEAVYALVRETAGSEQAFVQQMNVAAQELGMSNTHFTNPIGYSEEESYTSLDDLAGLLAALAKDENFREIASTSRYSTGPLASRPEGITFQQTMSEYASVRQLDTSLIDGGKTGSTSQAEYCMASFHMEGETAYLVLTAKAKEPGLELVDHMNFYRKMSQIPLEYTLLAEGAEVATVALSDPESGQVGTELAPQAVISQGSYTLHLPMLADLDRYELRMNVPESLTTPLAPGQVVGTVDIIEQAADGAGLLLSTNLMLPQVLAEALVSPAASPTPQASNSPSEPSESGPTSSVPSDPSASVTTPENTEAKAASPSPLPWVLLVLVILVLLMVALVGIRNYRAKKRQEKLQALRKLQNSYSYRPRRAADAAEILEEARRKKEKSQNTSKSPKSPNSQKPRR